MKTIILFLSIILSSCVSTNRIHEDKMYLTRKYCGDFVGIVPVNKRYTRIYTTQATFKIVSHIINVPIHARCYLRYIPQRLPDHHFDVWILYFTWDGTDDLYMLSQNIYTGEIDH